MTTVAEPGGVAPLRFGVVLPTMGEGTGAEALDAAARAVAEHSWSSVWVTDHLMVPDGPEAGEYGTILEALTALTWVGARHPTVTLGTSVVVPALRDAPMLAKQLATLDLLVGGRIVVGIGVGDTGDLVEHQNMGKGDRFADRGAYADEAIELWRHLWSGSTEPFEGRFHTLRDFTFAPLPPRRDRIPIVCGGRSGRALRRAALLADGYHAAQTGPADLAARLPELRRLRAEAGRPDPQVSVRVRVRFDQGPGSVPSLHGAGADMVRMVRAFAQAGAHELVLVLGTGRADEVEARLRRFQTEVVEPYRAGVARGGAGS